MTTRIPRPPVPIDAVFDDPACVDRLVTDLAPYWPVQRYFANRAEYATLSGQGGSKQEPEAMVIAPVFRGD